MASVSSHVTSRQSIPSCSNGSVRGMLDTTVNGRGSGTKRSRTLSVGGRESPSGMCSSSSSTPLEATAVGNNVSTSHANACESGKEKVYKRRHLDFLRGIGSNSCNSTHAPRSNYLNNSNGVIGASAVSGGSSSASSMALGLGTSNNGSPNGGRVNTLMDPFRLRASSSISASQQTPLNAFMDRSRDVHGRSLREREKVSSSRVKESIREREREMMQELKEQKEQQQIMQQNMQQYQNDATEREIESIRSWQRQWKKVLSNSSFYFDGIEDSGKEKAKKVLMNYGSSIETFFHGDVSHVITNRPLNMAYPSTDIITQAKQRSMKLWSFDKLLRFLSHLADNPASTVPAGPAYPAAHSARSQIVQSEANNNLYRMLRDEKINGPADSDPRAKRDDIYYFKGPYIYVRDASQLYRPIMIREYSKVIDPEAGDWPQFRHSGIGKCPFVHEYVSRKTSASRLDAVLVANTVSMGTAVKQSVPLSTTTSRSKRAATNDYQVFTSKGPAKVAKSLDNQIIAAKDTHSQKAIDDAGREEEFREEGDDEEDCVDGDDSEMKAIEENENLSQKDYLSNPMKILEHEKQNEKLKVKAPITSRDPNVRKKTALTPVRMTSARVNASMRAYTDIKPKKLTMTPVTKKAGHEMIATGLNMSNATSNIKSMTQSGGTANGLSGNISNAQSKEVNSLKRKVFERKIRPLPVPQVAVKKNAVAIKEMRPGYCENCKDRFDDFDEHAKSRKHRKFALNDDNFRELDNLLVELARKPRQQVV
ncbi:Dfp1/Him1, central region-domain-containing protein [Dipodascopsis uninucleata]